MFNWYPELKLATVIPGQVTPKAVNGWFYSTREKWEIP